MVDLTESVLTEVVARLLDGPRPLPLVLAGNPVLRTAAVPYDFSLAEELWAGLLEAMYETMRAAPGVGLAAPQVGIGIRVAVIEDPAVLAPEVAAERERYPMPRRVLVNPRYEPDRTVRDPVPLAAGMVPPLAEFYEGCLSVPGYQAVVARSTRVRLRCQDENGHPLDEVISGWAARIVAHETDHLDGVLYLDRALTRSLSSTRNLIDLWAGAPMPTIRAGLGF